MRQGNDTGTQYRSAIYYYSKKQKEQAETSKRLYEQVSLSGESLMVLFSQTFIVITFIMIHCGVHAILIIIAPCLQFINFQGAGLAIILIGKLVCILRTLVSVL